jgi:type I restriction enzyme M protein
MTAQQLATLIWDIKDIIRDVYEDPEVENVILPFTLLRRMDCVLQDKKPKIDAELAKIPASAPEKMRQMRLDALLREHNLAFYNSSKFTLSTLLAAPSEIADNFKIYLEGFTNNVKDILNNFTHEDSDNGDLTRIYSRLDRAGLLFAVTQAFVTKADLRPEVVDNAMMGTAFETVIRWSKESSNTMAGQFYTPKDIVRLLVSLVMCGKEKEINTIGQHFSIYDPCCGTGGMLTVAKEYLESITDRSDMRVYLYGQEKNEKTYAICKSDILLMSDAAVNRDDQIAVGNTLTDDKFAGKTFNYMLANPPFGVKWKMFEAAIKEEAERANGRFSAGLPSTSDGSLLFLQHMISKMDGSGSRIGIVLNGSPLFNGDADSGWSNIRKMLLDRDILDAIVAIPKNLFYSTDIQTYLWILDNNKPKSHRGKVLLIDGYQEPYQALLQTNLGKKRYEISEQGAHDILNLYRNYTSAQITVIDKETGKEKIVEAAKLLDNEDFLYTKVTVERPLRLVFENVGDKILDAISQKSIKKDDIPFFAQVAAIKGINATRNDADFFEFLNKEFKKINKGNVKKLRSFAITREDAPEVYDVPGKASSGKIPDSALRDSESIPFKTDVDEYFNEEVLRFVPDAWMDRSKDKIGCEFPFTKLFYVYKPLRERSKILKDLFDLDKELEVELLQLKNEL